MPTPQVDLTQKIITRTAIIKSLVESPNNANVSVSELLDRADTYYNWIAYNRRPAPADETVYESCLTCI